MYESWHIERFSLKKKKKINVIKQTKKNTKYSIDNIGAMKSL